MGYMGFFLQIEYGVYWGSFYNIPKAPYSIYLTGTIGFARVGAAGLTAGANTMRFQMQKVTLAWGNSNFDRKNEIGYCLLRPRYYRI